MENTKKKESEGLMKLEEVGKRIARPDLIVLSV
jgi:hypothetical protein